MAAPATSTVLLVDGYNVIGVASSLQQLQVGHGLDAARHQLTTMLANYSAFQGYQARLIFDAQYRQGQGNQEMITDWLQVHFTAYGQTADTHIEKFCAQARHQGPIRVIVATSDRAQQLTVTGYGAEWMSAQQLIQDIDRIHRHIHHRQRPRKRASGRLLAHSLDPVAQQRLEQLRWGGKPGKR